MSFSAATPAAQREVLAGLVERVTFHNEQNGFCVLQVKARGQRDLITVVGHAAAISSSRRVVPGSTTAPIPSETSDPALPRTSGSPMAFFVYILSRVRELATIERMSAGPPTWIDALPSTIPAWAPVSPEGRNGRSNTRSVTSRAERR